MRFMVEHLDLHEHTQYITLDECLTCPIAKPYFSIYSSTVSHASCSYCSCPSVTHQHFKAGPWNPPHHRVSKLPYQVQSSLFYAESLHLPSSHFLSSLSLLFYKSIIMAVIHFDTATLMIHSIVILQCLKYSQTVTNCKKIRMRRIDFYKFLPLFNDY